MLSGLDAAHEDTASVLGKIIQRAGYALAALLDDMGVNHRSSNVGMTQEFLDGADVRAPLQEVCRKAFRKVCALITFVNPTRRAATLMALLTTAGST